MSNNSIKDAHDGLMGIIPPTNASHGHHIGYAYYLEGQKRREVSSHEGSDNEGNPAAAILLVAAVSPYIALYYGFSRFPNETTLSVLGITATVAAATNDWVKKSMLARIAVPIVTALVAGGSIYGVHADATISPAIIPSFLSEHTGSVFDFTLVAGIALYPKTIRQFFKEQGGKIVTVINTLALTVGLGYGAYDNLSYHQLNPFKASAETFADTWQGSNQISNWVAQDFPAPLKLGANILIKIPAAFVGLVAGVGGGVGNGVTTVVTYAYDKISDAKPAPVQPTAAVSNVPLPATAPSG